MTWAMLEDSDFPEPEMEHKLWQLEDRVSLSGLSPGRYFYTHIRTTE